jgi:hypothetical protein
LTRWAAGATVADVKRAVEVVGLYVAYAGALLAVGYGVGGALWLLWP